MHCHQITFSSLVFLALSPSAIAQPDTEKLLSCMEIDADAARLSCYDREMARQLQVQQQAAAPMDAAAEETVDQAEPTIARTVPASVTAAPAAASTLPVPAVPPVPATPGEATSEMSAQAAREAAAGATLATATAVFTSDNADNAFGMTEKLAQEREAASGSALPEESQEPKQISAVVTDIKRQPHGEHIVALDNGQIWAEEIASRYFPVEIGDTVIIKKRLLRGYRLVAKSGKGFAVERLR